MNPSNALRNELQQRISKNPSYSLRSFAQSLKVSPSFLSQILSEKRTLSYEKAKSILDNLYWSKDKKMAFLSSISRGKISIQADQWIQKQLKIEETAKYKDRTPKNFDLLKRWYYLAICEYFRCENRCQKITSLCKAFNISPEQAVLAIRDLESAGFIELQKSRYRVTRYYAEFESTPSSTIRQHHQVMTDKAKKSIDSQEFHERNLLSLTIAIDDSKLEDLKKLMDRWDAELVCESENHVPNSVYQLNLQFFRLDKKESSS